MPRGKSHSTPQPSAFESLNPKQQAFVRYYTDGETQGNAKASAAKAGYGAPKQQGSRLLTFPGVAAAIAERAPKNWSKYGKIATAEEVLEHLTEMMRNGRYENNRLRAMELLAKRYALLVERAQIQQDIQAVIVVPDKIAGGTWEQRAEAVRQQQLEEARRREQTIEAAPSEGAP
jgi:phage terminase small subunit